MPNHPGRPPASDPPAPPPPFIPDGNPGTPARAMYTDASFLPLDTPEALRRLLAHSDDEPVVLFKHSLTCPVSARADLEMARLGTEGAPVYRLLVQRARVLSGAVSAELGVRHESPQAIVVHRGTAVFDASHMAVTAGTVRAALRDASGAPAD